MGSNKNLFIILGVAVLALIGTFMSGGFKNFSEGVDPAQEFTRSQGGGVTQATPAPTTPTDEATPSGVEQIADGAQPVTASGAGAAESAAEGAAEDAGAPGLDAADSVAEGDSTAAMIDQADSAGLPPSAEDSSGGDVAEGLADAEKGLADAVEGLADAEDLFAEDEELDAVERFKQMDPRDIIDAKYDDLDGKLTRPWDTEDFDNFIPQTGRSDPLTRIPDAFPNEIKPPREGATDDSLIETYIASEFATNLVNRYSIQLECNNVLQVGLSKTASFTLGESRFSRGEGGVFSRWGLSPEGVFVTVLITVVSIDTEEVMVRFTASSTEVTLGVTKTQYYIPSNWY